MVVYNVDIHTQDAQRHDMEQQLLAQERITL